LCLGGFVLPFARKLGHNVPAFDFDLPGVSSMSVDTHKYGYALKGTSVVLYRTKELRHSQYFSFSEWTGGIYTTPTIAGSRSTGMIAQCWASMVALGEDGYMKHTKGILDTVKILKQGISTIEGLQVVGEAEAMIVCFKESIPKLNIYCVADKMTKRGWSLNSLQNPPCVNVCITVLHIGRTDQLLSDLRACVEEIRSNPGGDKEGRAGIYGMASQLPVGPIKEMMELYNDTVYKL